MDMFGLFTASVWLPVISVVLGLLLYYYGWVKLPINEFKQYGIETDTGKLPFIGNGWKLFTEGVMNHDRRLYNKFKDNKIYGSVFNGKPNIMVLDLDLIKSVIIKQAGTVFTNKTASFGSTNKVTAKMITLLRDDHWKHVRSMLTPAFSSGKMRKMKSLIQEGARNLVENFSRHEQENKPVQMKNAFGCFSMDVTVSTIFGLQVNSLIDPDHQIVTNTKTLMSSFRGIRVFLLFLLPSLFRFLAHFGIVEIFPRRIIDYYKKLLDHAIEERKDNQDQVLRNLPIIPRCYCCNRPVASEDLAGVTSGKDPHADLLQLMVQSHVSDDQVDRETNNMKWSSTGLLSDEILAQSFIFIVAGYENISNYMTYVAYCLALNPDVQDRLIDDIHRIIGKQVPDYDNVRKIEYLEMVMNESARIHTLAPRLSREVSETTEIDGILFKKGWSVSVPVYAIHMDPEIWPDPDKFDPERFTAENSRDRHPCSYIPFGIGPRHCIAQRLSLFEAKVALVSILQDFKFIPCDETPIPLLKDPLGRPQKPVVLRLERISRVIE
ncbi:cytochrome P450 3A24-like [Tubulanus polymorphus]|uniref:cytochrome P450 3A24-like n=1 Tax=Tubulanus polymorphus TaxID=672921 RepID=UPI003DA270D7